jgi:serine/threonine protein phosphatase PrpC
MVRIAIFLTVFSASIFCATFNEKINLNYGFAEMQGRRPTMEDAHHVEITKDYEFFGLYDGHGGREVADFAAQTLHVNCNLVQCEASADIVKALKEGFVRTHKDLDAAGINSMRQGSTAVIALIRKDQLFVANTGDSRAVLCSAQVAISLSEDHKPDRPDEKKRIEDLGGTIVFWGVWRVNSCLALSRALGDKSLAPYIIPDPEITQRTLTPQDEFLIIACDGVWDVLNNQQAVDVVTNALKSKPNDFDNAAAGLRDAAYTAGSADNISVMIVDLKRFQQP